MEIYPNASDNKIKCERRYNEFLSLYNKIKQLFPYMIILDLEKNFLSKIIKIDENFFIKRKNQLNLFLKNINEHKELNSTIEFIKFIRDPNFDNIFFNEDESFCDIREFPESMRNHNSLANKIVDFIKNPFTNTENREIIYNDSERDFHRKIDFYNLMLSKFNELKKFVVNIKKF